MILRTHECAAGSHDDQVSNLVKDVDNALIWP